MATKKQIAKDQFKAQQKAWFAEYVLPDTPPKRKSRLEGLLVEQSFPFVVVQARKFVKRSFVELDQEDLEQAGMIGLLKGVRGFKPELGWAFSTYAAWWVFREMQSLAIKTQNVNIPKGCGLKEKHFREMEAYFTRYGVDCEDSDLGLPAGAIDAWRQSPMFFSLDEGSEGREKPDPDLSAEEVLIREQLLNLAKSTTLDLDPEERVNLEKYLAGRKHNAAMAEETLEYLREVLEDEY